MIIERLTFQAKYGQGDALVGLMKEFNATALARGMGGAPTRLCVDRTGAMFTVIMDSEFADMQAVAAAEGENQAMYGDPEFQAWFAKMVPLVERGERQLLESVDL